jgi:hypothetical protein
MVTFGYIQIVNLSLRALGFRNADLEVDIWVLIAFFANASIKTTFICTDVNSTSTTGTVGRTFQSNFVFHAAAGIGTMDHGQGQSDKNKKSCFHCIVLVCKEMSLV